MARDSAPELRAIAPLVVTGPSVELVGPCTLVTNGTRVIAFSSAELLRKAGEPLAVALTLDCKKTVPVTSWTLGRMPHMGVIELGEPFPQDRKGLDVEPLTIGSVCATVDTRGAPSALVTIARGKQAMTRRVIAVHVDVIDGGGTSDDILTRLASPDESRDAGAEIDGAALFSWMPADPVLGRKSEVLCVALASPYRAQTFRPRKLAALAELYGLDDLGRALPWQGAADDGNELQQVAGEIRDDETGPLAGLDLEGD